MTDWSAHYATATGFRWWPCEELVRFVAGRRFATVLEAGCGNGANLWFLAERAERVIGVDLSEDALRAADDYLTMRRVRDRVVLHQTDVRTLPAATGSVDLLVDCLTAQHLPWADHAALFAGYRRVLRHMGMLWLMHLDARTCSTRGAYVGLHDYAGLALFPTLRHFCLPMPEDLATTMHMGGFDVTTRGMTRGYPDGQTAAYTICEGTAL